MEFIARDDDDDDDDAGSVDPTTTASTTIGKKKKSKKKKKGANSNSNNSFPFPWFESRCLQLQTCAVKGRYLTAVKSMTPGTLLFREVPFVAQLNVEGYLCSTCYRQLSSEDSNSSLVRDDLSIVDVFCSTQCRTSMHPVLMMEKDVVVGSQPGCSTLLSTIASRTSCSADLLRIVVRCLCKMAAIVADSTGNTPVDTAGTVVATVKGTTHDTDATAITPTTHICSSTTTGNIDLKAEEGGAEGWCFVDNGDIIRATNTGVLTLEHHLGRAGTHSTAWTESITAAFTLLLPHLHLPTPYNDVAFAVALAARINVNSYEMTALTAARSSSRPDLLDQSPLRALGFGLFPALGVF